MRKVTKLMGISLLVLGLAACDGATKDSKAPADSAAASVPSGQQVSLLDGKLTFTLPNGLADQSDKLTNQPSNVHIYADGSNQRAVIVIVADKAAASDLETLAKRMEEQQRSRDANLQVITNKAVEINGVPMRQLDTVITVAGQKAYSGVLLGMMPDGKQVTLQITLPADNQQQSQDVAAGVFNTVKIK
ncbi:MAG: DcrB family lipoprotein [Enterobacterales bacterium]|uniref:DcrB family lipoprotein n=1 Tax=Serratia sp. (in: enterobacteria) TaxID=616 RepID=UPI003F3B5A70